MPRRWATFLDSSAMTEWRHRWDRMWVCLNTSPWDALLIVFLLLRLNLRQRKHPTPWEPEEQHIFLCNSKWWWGAEITHVSPGFPTFLLKFGTSDKEAGLIFFFRLWSAGLSFSSWSWDLAWWQLNSPSLAVNMLLHLHEDQTDSV